MSNRFVPDLVLKTSNEIWEPYKHTQTTNIHTNRTKHATGKTKDQAKNNQKAKLGRCFEMCLMSTQLEHNQRSRHHPIPNPEMNRNVCATMISYIPLLTSSFNANEPTHGDFLTPLFVAFLGGGQDRAYSIKHYGTNCAK